MKLNCSLCFIVSGVRLIKRDYRNRTVKQVSAKTLPPD